MDGQKINRKKIMPFIWIVVISLVVEVFLCNFSSWQSILYTDRMIFDSIDGIEIEGGEKIEGSTNEYTVPEGTMTIHIPQVNKKAKNLFFALSFSENEVVPYTVSLTDEGNSYPYLLPEGYIVPGVKRTQYANIHASGEVGEVSVTLTVPAGSIVQVDGIGVNARIPFAFYIGRFLVILFTLILFYLLTQSKYIREEVCAERGEKNRKHQVLITAAVIFVLMGLSWKLAHINPICITSPWPHHKQYQELAQAISDGHYYLDIEASQGLLEAKNPYDTIYLQANSIDYKADYAYRDGKYYVYFGIVPELIFYLPYYLLTGHAFPNYMAVFLFFSGFIVSIFLLYREMIRSWFKKTPFFLYLLLGTLTVCCGNYIFVAARPDLYDTPIVAALMFTAAGLFFWLRGKNAENKAVKIYFLLGSLCMALVAGCRPQMLLFSALAIPLFWTEVIKERKLFSKTSMWNTMCICLPYLVVAAGIMYYNAARFGSVFDFGATYSLTSNDMTKRGFNLHQAMLGIWHFFMQPPFISSDFPFLQGNQISSASYMGKLNSEYTYGGILACNAFLWVLIFLKNGKKELKEKGIWAFVLSNIAISVVIGIVDVTGAGILQRYMVDMVWGVWLASVVVILLLIEKTRDTKYYKTLMYVLAVMCILQAAYGFGIVYGNGDLSVNVRTSNPLLYYKIRSMFLF